MSVLEDKMLEAAQWSIVYRYPINDLNGYIICSQHIYWRSALSKELFVTGTVENARGHGPTCYSPVRVTDTHK